jgi:2-polyprenyl-3-methyl-5-hydroxy-6-metoxy-1,4-benzoquinol methylase
MDGKHIIELYERQAEAWVQARLRNTNFDEKAWLDRFCALIPSSGEVLDYGCGAGVPLAEYLSERGYAVTGIDSSAGL